MNSSMIVALGVALCSAPVAQAQLGTNTGVGGETATTPPAPPSPPKADIGMSGSATGAGTASGSIVPSGDASTGVSGDVTGGTPGTVTTTVGGNMTPPPPPRESYPFCSKTITDQCMQRSDLKRGKRR